MISPDLVNQFNAGDRRGVPIEADLAYLGSSVPLLAALPLHGDAGGIADFDPDWAQTGSIEAVHPLGDDALSTKPTSVCENGRAILGDVFVEQDARRRSIGLGAGYWRQVVTAPV